MRDILNKSLPVLIWISTGFLIIASCYIGAIIIRYGGQLTDDAWPIVGGFLFIIFGVTLSFVFAGMCFQLLDIRSFTKHTALALRRSQR